MGIPSDVAVASRVWCPPPYTHAHKKSPILPGEYEALCAELTDEAGEGKRKPMLQDVFLSFHV